KLACLFPLSRFETTKRKQWDGGGEYLGVEIRKSGFLHPSLQTKAVIAYSRKQKQNREDGDLRACFLCRTKLCMEEQVEVFWHCENNKSNEGECYESPLIHSSPLSCLWDSTTPSDAGGEGWRSPRDFESHNHRRWDEEWA